MRVAIYFTPPADHPLTQAAASWLGRDAFTGGRLPPPQSPALGHDEWDTFTAEPRRYGFHATIKAPFRLAQGRTLGELDAALADLCANRRAPTAVGRLRVAAIGGFVALLPEQQGPELQACAAEVVEGFDRFRAPLSVAELARRLSGSLTPAQEQHLRHWGYPHVFDQFRFHMSLTGQLPDERRAAVIGLLQERFKEALAEPIELDSFATFVEPEPGADLLVRALHRFGAQTG